MKITDIKPYPVWVGHRNQHIVKIETDEGIYGWGESGLSSRELAVVGAVKHYREFLIGRDPMRIGGLWQEMYRSQYFEGGRALTGAISAIDIALHDIVGKALNVPVINCSVESNGTLFRASQRPGAATLEELIANANLLLENGWNVIRTNVLHRAKPGEENIFEPRESISLAAEWLTALREAIGSEPVLGIDYHHGSALRKRRSFCQRMPSGTLDFLEEPIRDETPEAYESLRTMVDVPFAIGEEFSSKWQFLPYLERGITNFAH